jgi:hypothetical protein
LAQGTLKRLDMVQWSLREAKKHAHIFGLSAADGDVYAGKNNRGPGRDGRSNELDIDTNWSLTWQDEPQRTGDDIPS